MSRSRKKKFLLVSTACVVLLAAFVGRPALHLAETAWRDADRREPVPAGHADDASRLECVAVAETWDIPAEPAAAEGQLAALLLRAKKEGLHVSIAGARHSMGGHTIWPGGIVVNMRPFARLEYDEGREILHAGAGALWSEAIRFLNPLGRSVAVVQSFSSFSIGGSISVNAHGWQFREPPLGSTVEAMRVMLADGETVRCSRTENAELFSLVIGGYGLLGVILDADLRTVPDDRYRVERFVVPAADYESLLHAQTAEVDVAMAYGRLDVSPRAFLGEAVLNVFHRVPPEPGVVPALGEPALAGLRRAIFRGTVGSDYGKELRWRAETLLEEHMSATLLYRNEVLDDDVALYEDRSEDSTEILQEYFLPEGRMEAFLSEARRIVAAHKAELLNVTVRNVKEDADSFLRYADRDMIAFVFLFHEARSAESDAAMEPVTRALIDAALTLGGRYYLPYRLHATREQFAAAYPQAARFFERKRTYDPDELFQNRFYAAYGR
jgi:FAD/FMN-containing dehydrogenase